MTLGSDVRQRGGLALVSRKKFRTVLSIASAVLVTASCGPRSVATAPSGKPAAATRTSGAPTAPTAPTSTTQASCGAPRRFLPALVTTEYEGADIPSDESQITIRVPMRNYVLTLDLQGGTDLDWNDALPYWTKINTLLKPLESGR